MPKANITLCVLNVSDFPYAKNHVPVFSLQINAVPYNFIENFIAKF